MPRTLWIRDLYEGQSVRLTAHVITAELKAKRDGSPYLSLTLADRSGRINANLWNLLGPECARVRAVRFAEVCGVVNEYRGRLQLNLSIPPRDVGMPDDLSDFLISSPIPLAVLKSRLSEHIQSVANIPLRELLSEIFEHDTTLAARFAEHPAAQSMHHAFRHGLLHHTLEVADLTAAMAERQSRWGWRAVNRDLAVTGALLHDIGKTQEIEIGDCQYAFSAKGELLGHVTLGLLIVARAVAKVRRRHGFPDPLEQMLLHLISSHHGKGEWGSPPPPKTMEAMLVHMADKTSADLYYFHEAASQAADDEQFTQQFKLGNNFVGSGRRVYVGDVHNMVSAPMVQENSEAYQAIQRPVALPILRLLHIGEEGEAVSGTRVLPMIGRAAAGTRLLDPENQEGHCLVEDAPLARANHYLLRVEGDSMSGDGIEHGDIVVVRHQETAEPREIAVVLVPGGGPVIKRLHTTTDGIRLLSSNPSFPPLPVSDPDQLRVQGVVVGIARE